MALETYEVVDSSQQIKLISSNRADATSAVGPVLTRPLFGFQKTKLTIFARFVILMQSAGTTRSSFTSCMTDNLHKYVVVFNRTSFMRCQDDLIEFYELYDWRFAYVCGRVQLDGFTSCTNDDLHTSVAVFNGTIFWPTGPLEIWWHRPWASRYKIHKSNIVFQYIKVYWNRVDDEWMDDWWMNG